MANEEIKNPYTMSTTELVAQMGEDIKILMGLVKAMALISKRITFLEYEIGRLKILVEPEKKEEKNKKNKKKKEKKEKEVKKEK